MNAEERGQEMLAMKMGDLPGLARLYATHLSKKYGGNIEVLLKAWCHYAQAVEGLKSLDKAYTIDNQGIWWFQTHSKVHKPDPLPIDETIKKMRDKYPSKRPPIQIDKEADLKKELDDLDRQTELKRKEGERAAKIEKEAEKHKELRKLAGLAMNGLASSTYNPDNYIFSVCRKSISIAKELQEQLDKLTN